MILTEKINEISEYITKHQVVSNFEIAYLAVDKKRWLNLVW